VKCDVHWCNALSTGNSRWCAVHQDEHDQQYFQRAEGPYPLDISFEVLQKGIGSAIQGAGSALYDAAKTFGDNRQAQMTNVANKITSATDPSGSQQQLTLPGDLARTVGGGLAGAALGGPVGAVAGGAAGMGLLGAGEQAGDSSGVNINIPQVDAGSAFGHTAGTKTMDALPAGAKAAGKGALAGMYAGAPLGPAGIVGGATLGGLAGAAGHTPRSLLAGAKDNLTEGASTGLTGVKDAGGAALGALGAGAKKLGRGIAGGLGVPDWWSPDKTGAHGDKYKYSANAPKFVQNAQKEIYRQKLHQQGRFKGGTAATPDEQEEQLGEFL
jgi:hypothetical protein